MNNSNLQNDDVQIIYMVHEKEKSYIERKQETYQMISNFLNKCDDNNQNEVIKDENGKPFIHNSNLNISISNSKNISICAISLNQIGVDIEYKRKIDYRCFKFINELYYKFFSVKNLNDWVKLESCLKLLNLKLESAGKGEIISNELFKDLKFIKLNIDREYIAYLSLKGENRNFNYKINKYT